MPTTKFDLHPPQDFSPISDEILDSTILLQFERIVEKYPDRIALKSPTLELSYQHFNRAINNLAFEIYQRQQNSLAPVAYLFNNEVLSIIAMMATLKSGRPFVGVHPGYTVDLMDSIILDSKASLLLTDTAHQSIGEKLQIETIIYDEVDDGVGNEKPAPQAKPDDLFGIYYTSGTTGAPKGIQINHRSRAQNVLAIINQWFLSPSDRIPSFTSSCFLVSFRVLFGAFLTGAQVLVYDLKNSQTQKTLDWIGEAGLTIFRSTPSLFRSLFSLLPEKTVYEDLRIISLGGELATSSDAALFKTHTSQNCVLINTYSATETGTISQYLIRHDTPILDGNLPVGHPVGGKEILILDENGHPVDDGQLGEIVVQNRYPNSGKQKQAERENVSNVWYTGDQGRWLPSGVLEVVGRQDTQVKIRGYRIRLEEIDHALQNIAGVKDSLTIVHKFPRSGDRLVSYLFLSESQDGFFGYLRNALAEKLPSYKIPSIFIPVDNPPITPTGKLDRKKLPLPSRGRPDLDVPYMKPQTELEQVLVDTWEKVLELETVGVNDNFFELGGDSLIVLEMTLVVEKAFSKPVPKKFFNKPTISYLAELLAEENKGAQDELDRFALEKFSVAPSEQKSGRGKNRRPKHWLKKMFTLDDWSRLWDLFIVPSYMTRKTYLDARDWSLKWSKNKPVTHFIYARKAKLFSRWLDSFGIPRNNFTELFEHAIFTNLYYSAHRYRLSKDKKQDSQNKRVELLTASSNLYRRTLGELLQAPAPGELNEEFPIVKSEYFLEEYSKGKGIILVSFHGMPRIGSLYPLMRFLNIETIPVISYIVPTRQSPYSLSQGGRPAEIATSMNAEIALIGQKHLQQGGIVLFQSDIFDTQGKTYQVIIGDRVYLIKGGFAELSLNTGAPVIPFVKYCLPDGRIQMEFKTPLDPGIGNRYEKVERLIQNYGQFIENAIREHPESISWSRMKSHLGREKYERTTISQ